MVRPASSSPGKRIPYMARATASRDRWPLASAAWRSSSPEPVAAVTAPAYRRTPSSPVHAMLHPLPARSATAACVILVPGPRRRAASMAAGTLVMPSARQIVTAFDSRSTMARSM